MRIKCCLGLGNVLFLYDEAGRKMRAGYGGIGEKSYL